MATFSTMPAEMHDAISAACLSNTLAATPSPTINFARLAVVSSEHDAHISLAAKLSPAFPFLAINHQAIISGLQPCLAASTPLFARTSDVDAFAELGKLINFDANKRTTRVVLDLTKQTRRGAQQLLSAVLLHFPNTSALELRVDLEGCTAEMEHPALAGLIPVLDDHWAFPELKSEGIRVRDLAHEARVEVERKLGVSTPEAFWRVKRDAITLEAFGDVLMQVREEVEEWTG